MFRTFDAAFPPPFVPAGYTGVLGYLGGNTPHVWTPAEWRVFKDLKQAGIWVRGLGQNPLSAGQAASEAAIDLGFTPNAPDRRFIVIDMEAVDDDLFIEQFAKGNAGFDTVVYNSLSAGIESIPGVLGEWVALWDGISDIPPGTVAHQLAADLNAGSGHLVDASVWEDSMAVHFGWGPRKG